MDGFAKPILDCLSNCVPSPCAVSESPLLPYSGPCPSQTCNQRALGRTERLRGIDRSASGWLHAYSVRKPGSLLRCYCASSLALGSPSLPFRDICLPFARPRKKQRATELRWILKGRRWKILRLCYAFRVSRSNLHPQRKRRFFLRCVSVYRTRRRRSAFIMQWRSGASRSIRSA